MPIHRSILAANPTARTPIVAVLDAALAAVDPRQAVSAVLQERDGVLTVAGRRYDLDRYARIFVLGAGKAGSPMTQAVETALGSRIRGGLVVVKTDHGGPTQRVEIVEASHPTPDAAGVAAGRRILALAQEANADDLVVALLSGGGSALLVAPADGLTLEDKQGLTAALLACGATIDEVNCLRKHCSAVKGGQLARAVAPATLITLALSDVIGSPLDVIASGPTVADSTTWADAWSIVRRYNLEDRLPSAVVARLQAGLAGAIPDTPKPGDAVFGQAQAVVVADNRVAADAARRKAQELGFHTLLLTTYTQGEAREVAKVAVALGREVLDSDQPIPAPACLILGGETTVTLGVSPGRGGRNQELALSAALLLDGIDGMTVVSLATDGTDGPTDSAGGIAGGDTVQQGRALGLDAEEHLARHDAYPFLAATGSLLMTGPTQTNVNDLIFVFVIRPAGDRVQGA